MTDINYQDYEDELNPNQFKAMLKIASGLKTKIGESKAVTSKQITDGLLKIGFTLAVSEINLAIHIIRRDGLVPNLISNSKNAFYVGSNDEVKKYIKLLEKKEAYFKGIRVALLLHLDEDIETI